MKKLLFILILLLTGCTKNYVGKCYIDGDDDTFAVVDQEGNAYIKVYFTSQRSYIRALPVNGNEINCSLVERYFRSK